MNKLYQLYLEHRYNVTIKIAPTGKWMTFYKTCNGIYGCHANLYIIRNALYFET